MVSASLLGALAGSALAFVVGDQLGRKRELQLGAALYGARAALASHESAGLLCRRGLSSERKLQASTLHRKGVGFKAI